MAKIETNLNFFEVIELFQQVSSEINQLLIKEQQKLFNKVGLDGFELDMEQKQNAFYFYLKTKKEPTKRFIKAFDDKLIFITELADGDYEEVDGKINVNKELEEKIGALFGMIAKSFELFEVSFCLGNCQQVENQNEGDKND